LLCFLVDRLYMRYIRYTDNETVYRSWNDLESRSRLLAMAQFNRPHPHITFYCWSVPPVYISRKLSGQKILYGWMHEWSSRIFRICFHLQTWSPLILRMGPKYRFLVKFHRNQGCYGKILHCAQLDHSTNKEPKLIRNQTTPFCKSRVYGNIIIMCAK